MCCFTSVDQKKKLHKNSIHKIEYISIKLKILIKTQYFLNNNFQILYKK